MESNGCRYPTLRMLCSLVLPSVTFLSHLTLTHTHLMCEHAHQMLAYPIRLLVRWMGDFGHTAQVLKA